MELDKANIFFTIKVSSSAKQPRRNSDIKNKFTRTSESKRVGIFFRAEN